MWPTCDKRHADFYKGLLANINPVFSSPRPLDKKSKDAFIRGSISLKAPANEETLFRKHCFQECFLGAQTSGKQCFLAAKTKKHFAENKRLRMLNLRNAAYATL